MTQQPVHSQNPNRHAAADTQIGIAIVEWNGQILVGTRDVNVVLGGMQEFPGGKCHPGEPPTDCCMRECLEETGLSVEIVELIAETHHRYEHGDLTLFFYLCHIKDDPLSALLGNFRWVTVAELPALNFPSGNLAAIERLSQKFSV